MRSQKKSIVGPIVSVFVLVLIVSILAGLTFLFVASLKTQAVSSSQRTSTTVVNETITFPANNAVQSLSVSTYFDVNCGTPTYVANQTTTGEQLTIGNFTVSGCTITNATALNAAIGNGTVHVSYPYNYIASEDLNAYEAINDTEAAGATLTGYLPLIFLAIIFGAILTLVLKIILPYINLGQNMGGF